MDTFPVPLSISEGFVVAVVIVVLLPLFFWKFSIMDDVVDVVTASLISDIYDEQR